MILWSSPGIREGEINIFDFTDPTNQIQIAYHDRGSISGERLEVGSSWSVYWYNDSIISSEIAPRGLDILKLIPSDYITENEIAAANGKINFLNLQGQPHFDWPPSYALVRAYLDQLERNRTLDLASINNIRIGLSEAVFSRRSARPKILNELAEEVENSAGSSSSTETMSKLANTMKDLASES